MPSNYYNPYGYNLVGYVPQYVPQSIPTPTPAAGQQAAIIWVSGRREADVYPVAPNNAVSLWDSTAPCIYLKKADASGKPTMTIYDLVERTQAAPAPQVGNVTDYATKTELESLQAALTEIRKEVDALKREEADV